MCCPTRSKQTGSRAALAISPGPDRLDPDLADVRDRLDDPVGPGIADVVVRQRDDVDAGTGQADLERRIEREPQPVRVPAEVVGCRALVVDDRKVSALEQPSYRPRLSGAASRDLGPAELVAAAAGRDLPEAAVPREVGPLAEPHGLAVDVAVEVDVAGRRQRPDRGRVVLDDRGRSRSPAVARGP